MTAASDISGSQSLLVFASGAIPILKGEGVLLGTPKRDSPCLLGPGNREGSPLLLSLLPPPLLLPL